MSVQDLLNRIKERNIPQWAFAYLAAGWVALQVLDVVADPWGVTDGMIRGVQALLVFGFLFAMVLAWYHGEVGRQQVTGVEILLLATLLVIGGLVLSITVPDAIGEPEPPPTVRRDEPTDLRLAVLPTEIRTADLAGMEWAGLIQSTLVSELARVRGLGVLDASSLNTLLDRSSGEGVGPFEMLRRDGVRLAVRASVESSPGGAQVSYLLADTETSEVLRTREVTVADDSLVTAELRGAALDVLRFIEDSYGSVAKPLDLEPWLEQDPSNLEAQRAFLQGIEYTYRGIAGGGEYFRRTLEFDGDHIPARIWLISGLVHSGNTEEARTHVRELEARVDQASPFEQAMIGWAQALVAGDLSQQIAHLEVALGLSPRNNILLFNLGTALALAGRYAEAREPIRQAVDARWRYPDLYPVYGRIAIELGYLEGVEQVLTDALEHTSPSPYVYGILEALALFRGERTEAERFADQLRERVGAGDVEGGLASMVPVYTALARHARARGDTSAAVRVLRWAATTVPEDQLVRARFARALAEDGDIAAAEREYTAVREDSPHEPETVFALAETAERLGRAREAIEYYDAYLEAAPRGAGALRARDKRNALVQSLPGA